jgi:hypothetical protein
MPPSALEPRHEPGQPRAVEVGALPGPVADGAPAIADPSPRPPEAPIDGANPEPAPLVEAEPIAAPSPTFAEAPAEPPPLVIEIGRIDIRIASEAAPPTPAARASEPARPVVSLDEYLARRSRGDR